MPDRQKAEQPPKSVFESGVLAGFIVMVILPGDIGWQVTFVGYTVMTAIALPILPRKITHDRLLALVRYPPPTLAGGPLGPLRPLR